MRLSKVLYVAFVLVPVLNLCLYFLDRIYQNKEMCVCMLVSPYGFCLFFFFQEILVSPKMLTDHFPNNVCDMLALLKNAKMEGEGEEETVAVVEGGGDGARP